MTAPALEYGYDAVTGSPGQRHFKKHKVLPHPKKARAFGPPPYDARSVPRKYGQLMEAANIPRSLSLQSSHHTYPPTATNPKNHPHQRVESAPDYLPPTPPAQSRTSSGSQSAAITSSPTTHVDESSRGSSPPHSIKQHVSAARSVQSVVQTPLSTASQRPSTPPNQKSPPTPDVTPPLPAGRPRARRPHLTERAPSKSTTDSRTDSFLTAREEPYMSEEEDSRSTVRPNAPSTRTSQNTVRQASTPKATETARPVGLGLGLESAMGDDSPPRQKEQEQRQTKQKKQGDYGRLDGDWGNSTSDVEQQWDDNLHRTVTVRKRHAQVVGLTPRMNSAKENDEVVEDNLVTPTNAAKALRNMSLQESLIAAYPSPRESSDRSATWTAPSNSQSSITSESRRFSGVSSHTNASTVLDPFLADGSPRRRKTLRHMRKQRTLRDSSSDLASPGSSVHNSSVGLGLGLEGTMRQPARAGANGVAAGRRSIDDRRHDSYASTGTVNSLASARTRREIWKNGGIPVVVVPERRSSVKSRSTSREPSLRSSAGSKRSQRSLSVGSVPLLNRSVSGELLATPFPDRSSRRGRPVSDSDRSSEQRTIDYPPIVPRRTSSLSAPTSRNGSRTGSRSGSLTRESLKQHDDFQAELEQKLSHAQKEAQAKKEAHVPEVTLQPAPSLKSEAENVGHHHLSVDRHGDPLFGKRLSAQNTPFSQFSVETNGTAPEVSEAIAVSMFPHQNSSVVMVDHSARPSEGSDVSSKKQQLPAAQPQPEPRQPPERPSIKTTAPDSDIPVTPPQPPFSMDDVDSPLRNPRAPPEPPTDQIPPAIKFIPATPSGLTPGAERLKNMGNYFEEMGGGAEKPKRSTSLIRRALMRRRHSEYGPPTTERPPVPPSASRPGFLKRTLSLSRNVGKDPATLARGGGDRGGGARATMPAREREPEYPTDERPPPEENKLHPFWRPLYSDHEHDDHDHEYDDDDDDDWGRERSSSGEVYRYPPIDNRPPPRRSLSSRMRRTFAILPTRDSQDWYLDGHDGPDRRTIRRTASGSLRVMRHRGSIDSLGREAGRYAAMRPYTAPGDDGSSRRGPDSRPPIAGTGAAAGAGPGGGFWKGRRRSLSVSLPAGSHKILPAINGTLEGLQSLPRRYSERRREKRTQELRGKISGPREVRDGVGEVIRRAAPAGTLRVPVEPRQF